MERKNKRYVEMKIWMKNNSLKFMGWEHRKHRTRKDGNPEVNVKSIKLNKIKKREFREDLKNNQ